MSTNPTLYLSNWSSHRTPGMHGPGRKWTIMANPRAWERGEGAVRWLTPNTDDLLTVKAGNMGVDEYRLRCETRWDSCAGGHRPGVLRAIFPEVRRAGRLVVVEDGDTLCCACSVAEARAGRCHRTWAAPFLVRAGWRVVLDGVEVAGIDVREVTS